MSLQEGLARLEARCRSRGLSVTVQRRRLLGALLRDRRHPTADELYGAVRREIPGLARATVYRALETFVRLGLVRRLSHPGGVVRYDPVTAPHHHVVCTLCGRLEDLPVEVLGEVDPPEHFRGFRVERATVLVEGLCPRCQKKQGGKR